MDFVVVDVETANQSPRSICQIGTASFQNGGLSALWGSLIDPEDFFSAWNITIHGIRPEHVVDAPNWTDIQGELQKRFKQGILASHTYFDLRAINGANERYGISGVPWIAWIDTCKVARAAWPHLSSYKLSHLARIFGIAYQAHNASEDARCAGEILLRAVQTTGLALGDLLRVNQRPVSERSSKHPH